MLRRLVVGLSTLVLLVLPLISTGQTISQSQPIHANTPFPAAWDQPPQHRQGVVAIKLTGITEQDFTSVATAMFVKYAKDMLHWPPITIEGPEGQVTVAGFSNQYDKVSNGGTGYLRLELYLKSAKDIGSYQKDYEAALQKQLKKLPASIHQETVAVLSPELEKKQ